MRGEVASHSAAIQASSAPIRVGTLRPGGGTDRAVRDALSADGLDVVADARSLDRLTRQSLDAAVVVVKKLRRREYGIVHGLRAELPTTPIVIVSDELTRRDLVLAERAGADGLVLHSRVPVALAAAVRAACAGQLVMPRDLAAEGTRPTLTVRERQVLGMVVLGCTNAEIAKRLLVAETTVKSHLSTAFAKLGVRSRSEAVGAILDPDRGLGTGILAISEDEVPPR